MFFTGGWGGFLSLITSFRFLHPENIASSSSAIVKQSLSKHLKTLSSSKIQLMSDRNATPHGNVFGTRTFPCFLRLSGGDRTRKDLSGEDIPRKSQIRVLLHTHQEMSYLSCSAARPPGVPLSQKDQLSTSRSSGPNSWTTFSTRTRVVGRHDESQNLSMAFQSKKFLGDGGYIETFQAVPWSLTYVSHYDGWICEKVLFVTKVYARERWTNEKNYWLLSAS